MSPTPTETASVECPLEGKAVDLERCARCFWRSSGNATCVATDRVSASDWRFLLRAIGV
jgi:hypothetical protein